MSGRERKLGDVVVLEGRDGSSIRAIWQGNQWATQHGHYLSHWQVTARPLVVIDPEDREQVEMLRDLSDAAHTEQQGHAPSQSAKGARGNALQAALREFADPKPPKPTEPTGLGAVVEDADGMKWILVYDHTMWQNHHDRKVWNYYKDIDVVRVLSEGVSS